MIREVHVGSEALCPGVGWCSGFVAVDPGVEGAAMVFGPRTDPKTNVRFPAHTFLLSDRYAISGLREATLAMGIHKIVMEDCFIMRGRKANPQTLKNMARRAGYVVGACHHGFTEVNYAPPDIWQRHIFGLMSNEERKKRKARAVEMAEADKIDLSGLTKAKKEGVADAWGIAKWWMTAVYVEAQPAG